MAKFPANDIITLLDRRVPHNLGESTSRDLTLGELIELPGGAELPPALAGLSLGYGTSRAMRRCARSSPTRPESRPTRC
jgi:hypothetical protein